MAIALPSFKEFSKKPVIAILYVAVLAIGYLYVDLRIVNNKRDKEKTEALSEMKKSIISLTVQVDLLNFQLKKSDSTVADMNATLRLLKQMGKIQ